MRTFFLVAATAALLTIAGCGVPEILTTPYSQIDIDPTTEVVEPARDSDRTPAQDLVENAPKVVSNPANIEAWLAIAGALTTTILTATGVYKYKKRKAAAKGT